MTIQAFFVLVSLFALFTLERLFRSDIWGCKNMNIIHISKSKRDYNPTNMVNKKWITSISKSSKLRAIHVMNADEMSSEVGSPCCPVVALSAGKLRINFAFVSQVMLKPVLVFVGFPTLVAPEWKCWTDVWSC